MKIKLIALALGAALLLGGCGFSRSYVSVTTHVDQRVTEDDPSVLRAETYQELISSILHFVSEGEETGTVRLVQYTGDVESDLTAACREVLEEDPLGAYALEGLDSDYSRIVSYYECTFTFTYRRTPAEIQRVSTAATLVSFREKLQQTMDSFGDSLAVRTSRPITEAQILDMVEQYYYETPELALGCPSVAVSFYGGDQQSQQLVEVQFFYAQDGETCQIMSRELRAAVSALLDEGADSLREELWEVYQELSGRVIYQGSTASGSAYRFMIGGAGTQEGAAMSLFLACRLMGLEGRYVSGTDGAGDAHCWLLVELNGVWSHLDLTLQDDCSTFLRSDADLEELGYTWDREEYPAAEGLPQEETSPLNENLPELALESAPTEAPSP